MFEQNSKVSNMNRLILLILLLASDFKFNSAAFHLIL